MIICLIPWPFLWDHRQGKMFICPKLNLLIYDWWPNFHQPFCLVLFSKCYNSKMLIWKIKPAKNQHVSNVNVSMSVSSYLHKYSFTKLAWQFYMYLCFVCPVNKGTWNLRFPATDVVCCYIHKHIHMPLSHAFAFMIYYFKEVNRKDDCEIPLRLLLSTQLKQWQKWLRICSLSAALLHKKKILLIENCG